MSTMRRPPIRFVPQDWQRNHALGRCGFAARGFWMEMICAMHQMPECGVLIVNDVPLDATALAKLLRCDPRTAARHLHELEHAGVFTRDSRGAILSRRMMREAQASLRGRTAGLRGVP